MADLKHSLLSLGAEEQLSHRHIDKIVFDAILRINATGNRPAQEEEIAKMTELSIATVNDAVARLQNEQSIRRGETFDNIKRHSHGKES
jgi:predicted transcriptional regulator